MARDEEREKWKKREQLHNTPANKSQVPPHQRTSRELRQWRELVQSIPFYHAFYDKPEALDKLSRAMTTRFAKKGTTLFHVGAGVGRGGVYVGVCVCACRRVVDTS